jgi:hypothetical protein
MGSRVATAAVSREVPNCDEVRPRMAKAEIAVTDGHTLLRSVIQTLIRNAPDKKEKLAADMGKDRAQMYRQSENGHLTVEDLDALGLDFLMKMALEVLEQVGPLQTPQAKARQDIRDIRRLLEDIEQALEFVA